MDRELLSPSAVGDEDLTLKRRELIELISSHVTESGTVRDPFIILGVSYEESMNPESVKKAFRDRCVLLHPDKGFTNDKPASDAFCHVLTAYKTVTDLINQSSVMLCSDLQKEVNIGTPTFIRRPNTYMKTETVSYQAYDRLCANLLKKIEADEEVERKQSRTYPESDTRKRKLESTSSIQNKRLSKYPAGPTYPPGSPSSSHHGLDGRQFFSPSVIPNSPSIISSSPSSTQYYPIFQPTSLSYTPVQSNQTLIQPASFPSHFYRPYFDPTGTEMAGSLSTSLSSSSSPIALSPLSLEHQFYTPSHSISDLHPMDQFCANVLVELSRNSPFL